jgi:hypothetical protein
MRPRVLIATVVVALVTSLLTVVSASPAAAALPTCTGYSQIWDASFERLFYVPSLGDQTKNLNCKLQRGDGFGGGGTRAAVYILQGNLRACNGAGWMAQDGLYGRDTEAVVTWVQAASGRVAVDGIYGPQTGRDAMRWAGYYYEHGVRTYGCYWTVPFLI